MNIRSMAKIVCLLAVALFVTACTQQGSVRPEVSTSMPSDMTDSTGSLGRERGRAGAGDIYVKLAVEYFRQGKIDIALAKAKIAVGVEQSNAEAHNVIALIYERLGEYGLADHHFKRSVRYAPDNSYALNAYGSFLCQRGRYEEADAQFQRALMNPLYKTPEVALTNAGICANRNGDKEKAETYLRKALSKNSKLPLALLKMAELAHEKVQYLNVRAYLQRYQEVARPTAASLWLGIQTERELGDQNAVASYSLMLRNSFPDSSEARQMEASIAQ